MFLLHSAVAKVHHGTTLKSSISISAPLGLLFSSPLQPLYPRKQILFVTLIHLFLEMKMKVEVIHNASVMGAVASCGLQLYNFGQTVSIPLWNENWEPDSFYEKIRVNKMVRAVQHP